ncbi:hypothetical protein AB1Y20_001585 [Prymnesium parvum]|uniref:Transmembrane protein 230 n=1 Tax=Prymnesium parvum TaxID=97485 RepID=A0AB34K8L7_PRYPA
MDAAAPATDREGEDSTTRKDHAHPRATSPQQKLVVTHEELSWKVVSILYALGVALCVLFAILQVVWNIESVRGFWIIFSPFAPCLVYGLYRYRLQLDAAKHKQD